MTPEKGRTDEVTAAALAIYLRLRRGNWHPSEYEQPALVEDWYARISRAAAEALLTPQNVDRRCTHACSEQHTYEPPCELMAGPENADPVPHPEDCFGCDREWAALHDYHPRQYAEFEGGFEPTDSRPAAPKQPMTAPEPGRSVCPRCGYDDPPSPGYSCHCGWLRPESADTCRRYPDRPPFDGVPWSALSEAERALVSEWHATPENADRRADWTPCPECGRKTWSLIHHRCIAPENTEKVAPCRYCAATFYRCSEGGPNACCRAYGDDDLAHHAPAEVQS
jgi:hypothetical protein